MAQVLGDGEITNIIADDALQRLDIDQLGLDRVDRVILKTIIEKFNGGPVGIDTIAAATSEERDTIEDVYEPYFDAIGHFLIRTSRGRMATQLAYDHLGITNPNVNASSHGGFMRLRAVNRVNFGSRFKLFDDIGCARFWGASVTVTKEGSESTTTTTTIKTPVKETKSTTTVVTKANKDTHTVTTTKTTTITTKSESKSAAKGY